MNINKPIILKFQSGGLNFDFLNQLRNRWNNVFVDPYSDNSQNYLKSLLSKNNATINGNVIQKDGTIKTPQQIEEERLDELYANYDNYYDDYEKDPLGSVSEGSAGIERKQNYDNTISKQRSNQLLETGAGLFQLFNNQREFDNKPKETFDLTRGFSGNKYQQGGNVNSNPISNLKPLMDQKIMSWLKGKTNIVNTTGYKDNASTSSNPINIIPSSNITMKGVSKPILAIPSNGAVEVMQPGEEHNFAGASYVVEKPIYQSGGSVIKSFNISPFDLQTIKDTSKPKISFNFKLKELDELKERRKESNNKKQPIKTKSNSTKSNKPGDSGSDEIDYSTDVDITLDDLDKEYNKQNVLSTSSNGVDQRLLSKNNSKKKQSPIYINPNKTPLQNYQFVVTDNNLLIPNSKLKERPFIIPTE